MLRWRHQRKCNEQATAACARKRHQPQMLLHAIRCALLFVCQKTHSNGTIF